MILEKANRKAIQTGKTLLLLGEKTNSCYELLNTKEKATFEVITDPVLIKIVLPHVSKEKYIITQFYCFETLDDFTETSRNLENFSSRDLYFLNHKWYSIFAYMSFDIFNMPKRIFLKTPQKDAFSFSIPNPFLYVLPFSVALYGLSYYFI